MKKITLLIFSCILATMFASCVKDNYKSRTITSEDDKLAGEKIPVGENESNPFYKLFVLNQGNKDHNNASLDFLRFTDNTYVRNAFSQMNPDLALGLGDTGNDLQIYKNSLWAVMNVSGIVEVMSAVNEKHIASISVPLPRYLTFHGNYAYVTSWGTVKDAEEETGTLYKISLQTLEKVDSLSVGYYPEGVAVCNNRLFVANGGGMRLGYDKTLTAIDVDSFKVAGETELVDNIELVTFAGKNVWVKSLGNYYDQHTSLSCVDATTLKKVELPKEIEELHVSLMVGYPAVDRIFGIGATEDISWPASGYYFFILDTQNMTVTKYPFEGSAADGIAYPYGIDVNLYTGDVYIADAGDFINPGRIVCYTSDLSKKKWEAAAGIGPARFALYYPL